jgi:hypothetical protein
MRRELATRIAGRKFLADGKSDLPGRSVYPSEVHNFNAKKEEKV